MASLEEFTAAVEELAVAVEKWSESAHEQDASSLSAFLFIFCTTAFFFGIGFFVFPEVVEKYYKKVRAPVCKLLLISLDVLLWVFCPILRALRRVIMFVPWDISIPSQDCQAVVRGWDLGVWVTVCWVGEEVKGMVEGYQEWRRELELQYQAIVPTESTGVCFTDTLTYWLFS